ncbi:hypothetical protein [Caulobacter mirabilis]|uniref:hypothetical protein n=1 Tax=Caulobacter mirabilis TaxID=69666 RepID=UPI001C0ECF8C|nr:hypothetical protein [Caulobacter mirabilis]
MRDSTELPPAIREEIEALCAEGDRLTDEGGIEAAVDAYGRAWERLPEPKTDWAAATWILSAIGEACYLGGLRTAAREALERAVDTEDGRESPLLRLRLGQVLHDLGEPDRAAEHLLRAHRAEGETIFADENPRYLAFVRERLGLPTAEAPAGAPGIMGLIRAFRGLLRR